MAEGAEAQRPRKEKVQFPWLKGPTREFLVDGGDNAVQMFGREGTTAERQQASRLSAAWMRARAETNWVKDCSYFSRSYVEELTKEANRVSNRKVKNCPQALAFFKETASGDYVNTMGDKPIVSLRVGVFKFQRNEAYGQYHGNDGKDWIVSLAKEDGKWWVSLAAPLDRDK